MYQISNVANFKTETQPTKWRRQMKSIALKSNHGNHSGFNRKWEVLAKSENVDELKEILFTYAERCSDYTESDGNGNVIDNSRDGEILYSLKDDSFNYDGRCYVIVTESEYFADIFSGNYMGYAPKEVVDYFENN